MHPALPLALTAAACACALPTTSAMLLGQSLNADAVRFLRRLAVRPGLALPQLRAPTVSAVDFAALRASGIRAVAFDKDNTLTAPYALAVHPRASAGLARAVAAFGAPGVGVVSNSAGGPDDPGFADALDVERSLGLAVVRHPLAKKPACADEVLDHFRAALGDPALALDEVAMVGDRLLTDVAFGNAFGMLTVYVERLTGEGDNKAALAARTVERAVWLRLGSAALGWRPPQHAAAVRAGGPAGMLRDEE